MHPKALEAFAGTGAFVDGDHCQFCKAAAVCRHRMEKYTEITKLQNMKPEELASNGELAKVLREASNIEKWLRQLKSLCYKKKCRRALSSRYQAGSWKIYDSIKRRRQTGRGTS